METIEDVRYALALSMVKGIGRGRYLALTREFGSAREAMGQTKEALLGVKGITEKIAEDIASPSDALRMADAEINVCIRDGIDIVPIDSDAYPQRLREKRPDAPIIMYMKGVCDMEQRLVLSVVGTRGMTQYGRAMCQEMIAGLAELCPDLLVVSGLANGVDVSAHEAALRCGLQTVAVLGSGLGRIYPHENIHIARRITTAGALISEFRYNTMAERHSFVERNRTVASVADAVLVVESGAKGGSLLTAGFAADYGVRVCAVPGDVGRGMSEGCNNLIRDGRATLVTSAEDIYNIMVSNGDGTLRNTEGRKQAEARRERAEREVEVRREREEPVVSVKSAAKCDVEALGLEGDALRVAKLLDERGAVAKDVIASVLDIDVVSLGNILFDMEMDDIVRNLPGDNYELM